MGQSGGWWSESCQDVLGGLRLRRFDTAMERRLSVEQHAHDTRAILAIGSPFSTSKSCSCEESPETLAGWNATSVPELIATIWTRAFLLSSQEEEEEIQLVQSASNIQPASLGS